jgi:hypothetical protein
MAGFADVDVAQDARRALRRASLTGRPLGGAAWVKALETATGRELAALSIGRRRSRRPPPRWMRARACHGSRACPPFS